MLYPLGHTAPNHMINYSKELTWMACLKKLTACCLSIFYFVYRIVFYWPKAPYSGQSAIKQLDTPARNKNGPGL